MAKRLLAPSIKLEIPNSRKSYVPAGGDINDEDPKLIPVLVQRSDAADSN
jgi:hypothetical protein